MASLQHCNIATVVDHQSPGTSPSEDPTIMGEKVPCNADKQPTVTVRGRPAFLPRSLQALALLILLVAVWNIGSSHVVETKQGNDGGVRIKSNFLNGKDDLSTNHSHSKLPERTLALLYPPGLLGGYRNQVIRFIGLCVYAKRNNYTQLFLPSLLWSTQLEGIGTKVQWLPIPMDWVFDIDYWNEMAPKEGLPRIVKEVPDSDCWRHGLFDSLNTTDWGPLARASFLSSGSLLGATNDTWRMVSNVPGYNSRRVDLLPTVQHCARPAVYGGGKMGGRLWSDMMHLREKEKPIPGHVDRGVLRALRPLEQWRKLASSCMSLNADETYVALHARIELEMMSHACGFYMERNLTNIFNQVQNLVETKQQDIRKKIAGLFVAVSRTGMEWTDQYHEKYQEIANHNLQVFDEHVGGHTKLGDKVSVFECGERLLQDFYHVYPEAVDHGTLLQAVVNFDLAVNAPIFVGVEGSSYSTDVFTTRYYLGRGHHNYRYTRNGKVEAVPNDGLPEPHVNCKTLNNKVRQKMGAGNQK